MHVLLAAVVVVVLDDVDELDEVVLAVDVDVELVVPVTQAPLEHPLLQT